MAYKPTQSYAETDYEKWLKMEQAEQQAVSANPAKPYTDEELMANFGDIITKAGGLNSFSQTGGYTKDAALAAQMGSDMNVVRLPGTGEDGWYFYKGVQRPVAEGSSGADERFLSDGSYAVIQYGKKMYDQAETDEERSFWNNVNERVRARAGYSGGVDGSMYINLPDPDFSDPDSIWYGYKTGAWKAENMLGGAGGTGGYQSPYQAEIDAALNGLLGRGEFSYDKDSDPLYQMYKDSYTKAGQRAMQDTLAQISARTGGLASSYAGSASQQTYNNYMAMLADKVPELYQLAYEMYQDDIANKRTDLDTLLGIDDMHYDRYRDTVGDQQWQQEFDYNAGRDAVSDSQYAQALAQEQVDAILAAGGTPSAQLLAQAGYSTEYADTLGGYYQREAMTSSGGGEGTPEPVVMDYNGLFAEALESRHPKSFIANNYKKFGFTSSSGLYDDYKEWAKTGGNDDGDGGGVDEAKISNAKRKLDGERTHEGKIGELERWLADKVITDDELAVLLDYIGVA